MIKNMVNKINKGNRFHIIMLVLGAVFLTSGAFHSGLWFDESYTVGLMSQNLVDLCKAATYDVHPLGYYIILRLYAYVFGNNIISLRIFSVIGAIILSLLGYTHIRKDFDEKTGFWFSFFIITMPSTLKYALQIRMYTWAPLFVTLTAIYAYRMMTNDNKKFKNMVLFLIFSVLSAYMHYYALVAVSIINIILLVYNIKKKTKLNQWFLLAAIQIALYLPGIYVFVIQAMLSNGSWIKVRWSTFFDTISFHFVGMPQSDVIVSSVDYIIPLCIGFLIYIIFGILFMKMRKKKKEDTIPVILALNVYFGIILIFLLISIFKPMYYTRYLIVSFGLLVFSFAYILAKCAKTYIKIVIVVIMLGLSIARAVPIYQDNYDASNTAIDDYLKANMIDGDIFLFDSAAAFSVSVKYQDVPTYFYNKWNWNIQKGYKAFGSKVMILSNLDDLRNYSGRIWIIDEGSAYKEVMDWYGTTQISDEKIQLQYYYKENNHEIILIDKKKNNLSE